MLNTLLTYIKAWILKSTSNPIQHSRFSMSLLLKNNYKIIWWFIFTISLAPSSWLFFSFQTNNLGINPLATITLTTGQCALVFLIITLSITPLRRLMTWYSKKINSSYGKRISDWNWIIRLRKMLGLYCFYYASIHLLIYLHYDLMWEWQYLVEDVNEKNYLLIGFISFILISLLAITSINKIMRIMGKKWKLLHQMIYLISLLVLVHYWMLVKVGIYSPIPHTILICILLIYRIFARYGLLIKRPPDDGEIVTER